MSAAVALLLACAEPRSVEPALAAAGVAARGEAQYQMRCATCHGAAGGGAGGTPALAGAVHRLSDAEVVDAMLNGRGAMSPLRMTDAEAADVLRFVRERFPGPR